MGQSDSKVKTSNMQTVTVKKHQKNGPRMKSPVATVSFGISNPSSIADFISETVWQEVFDTEAVNYCAIGKRDSAILLSDDQKTTLTSPQERVACEEVQLKAEANILHSVPDSCVIDSKEMMSNQQAENASIISIRQESDSNNSLLPQEIINPADKVLSPQQDTSVLKVSNSPPQGNTHSLNPYNTILPPYSTVSLNQESPHPNPTPTQTEANTIANNNTILDNKEIPVNNNNQVTTTNPSTVIPSSRSCTNFSADLKKHRPPMTHSESMHLIGERVDDKNRSILSHMPKVKQGRPSLRRNVRFEELVEETSVSNFR